MVRKIRFDVHPSCPRLKRMIVPSELLSAAFDEPAAEPNPLLTIAPELVREVRNSVSDRRYSGSVIECDGESVLDEPVLARFCDALVAGIGRVIPETLNTDARPMPAVDHVEIQLAHSTQPAIEGLHFNNPELAWPLHTDRALHEDAGDFVLVCKAVEDNASGGDIRLLHIDDLERLGEFVEHPLARSPLTWKGEERFAHLLEMQAARKSPGVRAPVFTGEPDRILIRYTDSRFRRPDSEAQLLYLDELCAALRERAERLQAFTLPVGGIYVVNNRYVLHGRKGFRNEPGFRRKLLRYCGNF